MTIPQISSLALFTHLLLPFAATIAARPPLESFIYGGCSPRPYTPNSPFSANLNSLLTSLTNSASSSSYNHLTLTSPHSQIDTVHGLYQCRGDLPGPDCSSCVAHAVSQLGATCPSSSGAVVQLQGCYVKYDAAPFLGVEDKSVVLKMCGPPSGPGRERSLGPALDEVLGGLVDGSNSGSDGGASYRAVAPGSVRGMAQCVGDLSVDQCRDCVDQAVEVVRSDCGSAAYGDVFLGKCYVRFGVAGSARSSSGGSSGKSFGTVKTFAIIAGLLAGVVILVIFITFLSTAFGGKQTNGK